MIFYLNRGLILEQALCQELESYLDKIHLDETYPNFHVKVTNNHPFAELYLHSTRTAADHFPAIVVTTETDNKTNDLMQLGEDAMAIGLELEDFEKFKAEMDSLPGICTLVDPESEKQIREIFEKTQYIYGIKMDQRKTDHVSIEIWADNNQLKNEVYEQIRLYISGYLQTVLKEKYAGFGVEFFDGTIRGERSNNYNTDFDIALSGAHIAFEMNYCISQIVLDSELSEITNEIEWEVINHVKNEQHTY
ncbi:MAG: hypothetical protein MJZ37_01220 [Bacilli bacterium]|nr:hypothetical protein [Bacilli bacterium]